MEEMKFKARISKTGNSLAVFIPRVVAATLGLKKGDEVIIIIRKEEGEKSE
ncbi:AbrB/MazE/SpoVT family DNA-binding domain-containing protein [Candidatus Woesearchaeota archaeon]|nr:AbrB/MazE/SpoVT family DNA-binding domain-containing protein [Candidatus Woesearchaeota archaeon]